MSSSWRLILLWTLTLLAAGFARAEQSLDTIIIDAGYDKQTTSSDALDTIFFTNSNPSDAFDSRDFRRTGMVDTDFFHTLSDDSILSFGVGYSDMEMGDFEELGYFPMKCPQIRLN